MATKAKAKETEKETPEKEAPDTPEGAPLLDLSDAAVRKMIKLAKKRGYVTYEQLNAVLPSEEVTSEKIEDILAMLNEMGINTVESEEAEAEEEEEKAEEADDEESEGDLVEAKPKALATTEKKEPSERTDDPVRMYLREMGSVELLSREGEIAIAKRIEAGREAMIAGLCESPLTFQAIIIWRDELNDGKVFLRDIIDLEATYAGPDAKNQMAANAPGQPGADGQPAANGGTPFVHASGAPSAPTGATPFKAASARPEPVSGAAEGDAPAEGDMDDDEFENSMSLAAIEAELKPKVLEILRQDRDRVQAPAQAAGPGHREQAEEPDALACAGAQIQEAEGRDHRRGEVAAAEPAPHRRAGRPALRHQPQARRLRRPADAAVGKLWRRARRLPEELPGLRARPALAQPRVETFRQGLEEPRRQGQGQDQGPAPRDPVARRPHRPRDRRVPQDRAHGAEGRARSAPGEEGNGGGEPAPRHLHRQEIHQPRPAIPRPDPGRQYRPDEGGR